MPLYKSPWGRVDMVTDYNQTSLPGTDRQRLKTSKNIDSAASIPQQDAGGSQN